MDPWMLQPHSHALSHRGLLLGLRVPLVRCAHVVSHTPDLFIRPRAERTPESDSKDGQGDLLQESLSGLHVCSLCLTHLGEVDHGWLVWVAGLCLLASVDYNLFGLWVRYRYWGLLESAVYKQRRCGDITLIRFLRCLVLSLSR